MPILKIDNVTKEFGGLTAVADLNLNVEKGELIGVIGPNGAGKTTVFNVITGIYEPTAGSIKFKETEIAGMEPYKISKLGIARTFQNLRLFRNLSVLENVKIANQTFAEYNIISAIFRNSQFRAQEREIKKNALKLLDIVGLSEFVNEKAGKLPYGFQRKLEIARALALKPEILLLDEPAAGMNPDESQELMEFIAKIRNDFDLTIILIEHHMEVVMGICERILVLNFGKTIAEGTPEEIQSSPEVISSYLGEVAQDDFENN
jgi:branched-chain amino acid transport system ATP-binding protein